MNNIIKVFCFIRGLGILVLFYFLSLFITNLLHITIPPAILGLILFAIALITGLIKEKWVNDVCNILINNMAMFLVPFIGGLIVYKTVLMKNWLVILFVIFVTTTLTIVLTGLFVEHGLKVLRLYRMRKHND